MLRNLRLRFQLLLPALLLCAPLSSLSQISSPSLPVPLSSRLAAPQAPAISASSLFRPYKLAPIDGPAPEALTVADLDKNGTPDLVVALQNHGGPGLVAVALGYKPGLFTNPATYNSGGDWAEAVAVADLNNDGKPDIAVANYGCSNVCHLTNVGVLLGNGDGTFQTAVPYDLGTDSARAIAIADMNNDGNADLIVATRTGVILLLGNGNGTFQPAVALQGGMNLSSVAVGDLNGDGIPDVAAAGASGASVLLGKGKATFQSPVFYPVGISHGAATSVVIADVNDDGAPDLVAADRDDGTLGALLNRGKGTFRPIVTLATPYSLVTSIAVADVNGDLKPDLLAVDSGPSLNVYLGNEDGTFQSPLTVPTEGGGNAIAVSDLNNDRRPDVFVLDGSAFVDVLVNKASASMATTTTLVSSANPSTVGESITLTATVSSPAGPPPTGELITFKSGAVVLGAVPLKQGVATLAVSTLTRGTHSLSAHYPGDTDFLRPSTSLVLKQVVTNP